MQELLETRFFTPTDYLVLSDPTVEQSNQHWEENKHYYNQFSTIIVTDTSTLAKPFIQNMDKHSLNIIIYITNRFDYPTWPHFCKQDKSFYDLYREASSSPRVRVVADNNYDKFWASQFGVRFFIDSPMRTIVQYNDMPAQILHDKVFIHNNGTPHRMYKDKVPVDCDVYCNVNNRYRDKAHVLEYKGFLHLPYQANIISLWENLACGIVYFVPTIELVKSWIKEGWYMWEEKYKGEEIVNISLSLSEWYHPDVAPYLIYFDSWEDFSSKYHATDFPQRRSQILAMIKNFNETIAPSWKALLSF